MTSEPDERDVEALRARCRAAEERLERLRWEITVARETLPAGAGAEDRTADAERPPSTPAAAVGGLALYAELERHRRMLADMQASTSWRITRPLRALKRLLRPDGAEPAAPTPPAAPSVAVRTTPEWRPDAAAVDGPANPFVPAASTGAGDHARYAGKKVAVLAPVSPDGSSGGAERLYAGLAAALGAFGCDVELIEIAVHETSFETIQDAYRTFESLDLRRFDCVVSTKAPSYAVFHPNHVVYLVHTVRAFYDMFDAAAADPERVAQRAWIHRADGHAIGRARARFAIGAEVAGRLSAVNGLAAGVLHPGLDPAGLHLSGHGDYFFLPGRLHPWKRVDLAIRAVRASRLPMKLVIAGDGESEAALHALAAGDPRIVFLGRVPDDVLRGHYAACLAVPFLPLREDYGYVAIEAFASAKAVVTCADSGEPARIVTDGVDGLVVAPEVDAVRRALERLWEDRDLALALGRAARETARRFGWRHVAETLLAAAFDADIPEAPEIARKRVAVLDMQPITPAVGGGRVRLLGLYRDPGPDFAVRYVGSFDWPGEPGRTVRLSDTLTETLVPLSEAHHAAARAASAEAGGKVVIDALFGEQAQLSPAYVAVALEAIAWAEIVVFSHPWVAPLVPPDRLDGKLVVYDAQNCEGRLKAQVFDGGDPRQRAVIDCVTRAEASLGARADLVIACSEADRAAFVDDYGWPREKIAIVPNGAFVRDTAPAEGEGRRAARLALGIPDDLVVAFFLGSDYPPNVAAAAFVAGPLAADVPDVLFVIGGGCGDRIASSAPNCRVVGSLSEEARRAWLLAADIALNPMFAGSGTNVKMFDYMAHGLPVVATPGGARGIAARTEAGIVVAGAERFADEVEALAAHPPAFRQGLGRANRAWASRNFDWQAISAGLGQLLRGASAPAAPRAGLRVAHLSTTGLRCGIGEYTRNLIAALADDGALSLLLTASSAGEAPDLAALPQPALIAWRRDTIAGRHAEIGAGTLEAITAWDAGLLVVQFHPGFYARGDVEHVIRGALAAGIATRLVVHSFLADDAPLMRRLSAMGCVLFSHSPTEVKRAAALGVPLAHLPMPIAGAVPQPPKAPASGGPHIVANGFMRRHKGFRQLIAAMPAILRGHPGATLTLLAPPYPAPDSESERAACLRLVQALGLGAAVTVDGTFRDRPALLARIAAADLAVLPYEESNEGGSAAAGDCLAAGVPLIVSPAPIFDGVRDCSVTAEADPAAIAHAVLMLTTEPARRDDLRAAARRYRDAHTWAAAARRLVR